MPKRSDIKKILIIGAGPIIIGQACEFDYSGTQACKALKEEGYEVVLVNSNPATIMTDPDFADQTYIEPVSPEYVAKIIAKEKPDAMLATMGGQTSLNVAVALAKDGTLEKHNVELIGAKLDAIELAEDREKFKDLVSKLGLKSAKSGIANNMEEGKAIAKEIGLPLILRPAFTLGGSGGGIAYSQEEFEEILSRGLTLSPTKQVLIEQSIAGWKEFEMEVMRDLNDNVVIICSIENLDPMGVHTGDSITVAPIQTLSDKEYQIMRDASINIIRAVGVDSGGCNIQFASNPETGELVVIEMNPRVSRSSALASKATGFPIAKIAAKLAIGYSLDEIPNDITKTTMASFEPTLDYVVTKIPRFAFEKFPGADNTLGTQMKSVGETMAIGRSFKESFQKAMRSLETGYIGFIDVDTIKDISFHLPGKEKQEIFEIKNKIQRPNPKRCMQLFNAFYNGLSLEKVFELSKIDPWFLAHLKEIVDASKEIQNTELDDLSAEKLLELKKMGFSDKQIALLMNTSEIKVRSKRIQNKINPVYKTIDTCAGEFESYTPYHYSSYDEEDEVRDSQKEKIIIIGGGPNRIGQGIEFDYCCVHAALALKEAGYETIMINNNPETVSTDYDTSDKLYFEPITSEDVLAIWNRESQNGNTPLGIIVQLGGQTPLNICKELEANGVNILGTLPEAIDLAEDRERFGQLLDELELKQTPNGIAFSTNEAREIANKIKYPVVVRPSYVLGGRGMEIVYNDKELNTWVDEIIKNESDSVGAHHIHQIKEQALNGKNKIEAKSSNPILIDKFLEHAIEIDVDAISDGENTVVTGIMEHIEYAGIHSGDSACVLPSQSLAANTIDEINIASQKLAQGLKVKGPLNIQFAIKDEEIYILEVNPRASRTLPFVSKASGKPWAKIASLVLAGKTLKELNASTSQRPKQVSVKEAVFSFGKFAETSVVLGPEMKSTGEVMGISEKFANSFAKAQISASLEVPASGAVFISVNDADKPFVGPIAKGFADEGFEIIATKGTAQLIRGMNIDVTETDKLSGSGDSIVDLIKNDKVHCVINVPAGREPIHDHVQIGQAAINNNVPVITTITGASATLKAIAALKNNDLKVSSLQERFALTSHSN